MGRLAESVLRQVLDDLAPCAGFQPEIAVLPISVAVLMASQGVVRHLTAPPRIDRVILPGLCRGDLDRVREKARTAVELGPEDLRDRPRFFDQAETRREGYGAFDIEILAAINHAPRLSRSEILAMADQSA